MWTKTLTPASLRLSLRNVTNPEPCNTFRQQQLGWTPLQEVWAMQGVAALQRMAAPSSWCRLHAQVLLMWRDTPASLSIPPHPHVSGLRCLPPPPTTARCCAAAPLLLLPLGCSSLAGTSAHAEQELLPMTAFVTCHAQAAFEDVEFCVRARKGGARVTYDLDAVVRHHYEHTVKGLFRSLPSRASQP